MTQTFESILVATHDQLSRLALLVTGDPTLAARLFMDAAHTIAPEETAAEAKLLRAFAKAQTRYGRWQPNQAQRTRAGLDAAQSRALVHVIGKLAPRDRLIVGLHYLRGLTDKEIAALLPEAGEVAEVLGRFRLVVATALGFVPADAEIVTLGQIDQWLDGRLDEVAAIELRGQTFADAKTRTLRDGMLAVRNQLPQIVAGVFSAPAPATLLPKVLAAHAPVQRTRVRVPVRWAALGALVIGIVALSALIVVLPGLRFQAKGETVAASPSTILDAALHRFERPPLAQGILHERYNVVRDNGGPVTIERWYDYARPNRLASEVRSAGETQPRFSIRSDGRGTIEYQRPQTPRTVYQWTADQAELATPVLRSALIPISFNGSRRLQPEIGALYLAQAQANGAVLAGRTTLNGREAFLLRYSTYTLPTERSAGTARQVLLSIDAELWALLRVTILPEGSGESVALVPWQAELIEILDSVPDTQFAPSEGAATTVNEPRSLSIPNLPEQVYSSLDVALGQSQQALFAPTNLPEAMRGFVLSQPPGDQARFVLLYEGEFQSLIVAPADQLTNQNTVWSDERQSGAYRYRTSGQNGSPGSLLAQVWQTNAPAPQLSVMLTDPLSTPSDREARLRDIIASLTPVTRQNVGLFPQLAPGASS